MNAHVNQRSGNGPLTNRASHLSSAKNSSGRSCRVTNWSYALNASVAYAVMRACLICSVSAFCSTLSCLYMVKAPPCNLNGRMHSTFFIVQSSHTSSTFSTHNGHINNGHIRRSTTKLWNQLEVKHLALHP